MWSGHKHQIQRYRRLADSINPLGGFSPSDLAGHEFQQDNSVILSLFQDAGKTVPVVASADQIGAGEDLSGNGRDATQITAGKKPIFTTPGQNGLSIARYAITSLLEANSLAATFSGDDVPISIYIGFKQADNIGTQQLFGFANNVDGDPLFSLDAAGAGAYRFIRRDDTTVIKLISAGTPDTNAHLLCAEFTGTTGTLRLDGAVIGIADTDLDVGVLTLDRATIGARDAGGVESNFANMDLFEINVFSTILSAADRGLIQAYYSGKWNITIA